jgi:signal transduction histidine kinase
MTMACESSPNDVVNNIEDVAADERMRPQPRASDETALLEMIASGHPLPEILGTLCRYVEQNSAGVSGECLCGIYLVDCDSQKIDSFAAPNIPLSFSIALSELPLRSDTGPCAKAVCLKIQVIAADLELDPLWQDSGFRTLATAHNVRSCWSTPIFSSSRQVLGTFAILHRKPAQPSPVQQELIRKLTSIVSIAIDARSETAPTKLKRDLAEIGEIMRVAAFMTRDLIQPLSGILINANTCLRILSSDCPDVERARATMHRMLRDCARTSTMIARLQGFFSMTEGERKSDLSGTG